ncbi:hypothetical protein ACLOJK_002975 [Asimina triloba]
MMVYALEWNADDDQLKSFNKVRWKLLVERQERRKDAHQVVVFLISDCGASYTISDGYQFGHLPLEGFPLEKVEHTTMEAWQRREAMMVDFARYEMRKEQGNNNKLQKDDWLEKTIRGDVVLMNNMDRLFDGRRWATQRAAIAA